MNENFIKPIFSQLITNCEVGLKIASHKIKINDVDN